jgi:hypothetical protein
MNINAAAVDWFGRTSNVFRYTFSLFLSSIRTPSCDQTFLKIIAENTCLDTAVDTSNSGMKYTGVVTAPRDVRVAFVEQEPPMLPGTNVTARYGS